MKTFIFLLCCCVTASAQTQSLETNVGVTDVAANPPNQTIVGYQTGVQDGNSRVWQKIVQFTDAQGNVTYQTNNAYTELATGLNHLVNGQWVASSEQIDISADGNSALATNGQHQAYFPGDIYSGQIELVTPDGKQLYSRPVGLSYDDGTNTVLIAALTNSTGEILSSGNQVLYTNAFIGFAADLLYTYTKAGFEQDIILREQPPTPASFGLNPDTVTLQVLTEFFNPPQPVVTTSTVPTDAGNLEDDFLDFGAMQMIPGKAFQLGTTTPTVGVDKQWLTSDGRQLLVEEVPVVSIADELENLPLPQTTSIKSNAPLNVVSTKRLLPMQRMATVPGKHPMQMAQAKPSSRGLVLDYVTMTSQSNFTFQGDTTYYISGGVNLSGTNTFEGGAVLKYTNNASLNLSYPAQINCLASAYRPVIFTARDDNSVGNIISGSTGNPTNYYANPALSFYGPGSGTYALSNFRIAWANTAIGSEYGSGSFYHGQLVNCLNGISWELGEIFLRNVLFANVQTNINITYAGFNAQNTTFSGSSCLAICSTTGGADLTNCILANVACLTNSGFAASLSADHNGFYNSQEIGTNPTTNSFYPFQSAAAGNYYLTNGCAFTNAGTVSIDSTLLASLAQKTTYPPLFLTNQTISVNTNFGPQALRDTESPGPDLGYHYDPIDYIVDSYVVTNATLTVTDGGTVFASYNEPGIQLQGGSAIVSTGSPLYPNWFVRYTSVQEESNLLGGTNASSGITVNAYENGSVWPTGQYLFSKFAAPAGCGYLFDDNYPNAYTNLLIQDCELGSGANEFGGDSNTVTTLQNNLFDRSAFNADATVPTFLSLSNNLFFGTTVFFYNDDTAATNDWEAFNNSFDTCAIYNTENNFDLTFGGLINGYNAYLNCSEPFYVYGYSLIGTLWPTNASDIITNVSLAYETGPFGTFYQPTNSPLLNMGSTNANLLGLYHFTVTTNEVVEGTNIVSIGYHYVAADTNGNPLSTPWDGIPDYLADANGDGLVDDGETPWCLAILTQPVNQVGEYGDDLTFSVGAQGMSPISYQWSFNGTDISGATNSTLTIYNAQTNNDGNYYVVVSDPLCSVTSSVATLLAVDPVWTNLSTGNFTNYTFQGDTTYYVKGVVALYGTSTFEGGAVLKYSTNGEVILESGKLNWLGSAYHPVIFTAKDDNTEGDIILASPGNPSGYYAPCTLEINGTNFSGPISLNNFRIAYAKIAISNIQSTATFSNGQMFACDMGCGVSSGGEAIFDNCLFVTNYLDFDLNSGSASASNVTFSASSSLASGSGSNALNAVNCILANITNSSSSTLSGNHNGFYNSTNAEFGSNQIITTNNPFQMVGAGKYYLTNGCIFLGAGTNGIDSTLKADLAQRTTHPPVLLTSNITISASTNLSPNAQRDTNNSPDLGYHYDPLDYCWDGLIVTNATLTLPNGVAIGIYGASGLVLQEGASLVSEGTATNLNQLVNYESVQEEPITWGATSTQYYYLDAKWAGNAIQLQFTDVSSVAMLHDTIYFVGVAYDTGEFNSLSLADCQVSGMLLYIYNEFFEPASYIDVGMTNNLFFRSHLDFLDVYDSFSLGFYNNLCFGGEADFYSGYSDTWYIRNNLFDAAITGGYEEYNTVNDHNGYDTNNALTKEFSDSGGQDVLFSEDDYQVGPLGTFYYPTNDGGNLSALINAGSTNASALGLYHYTVTTNLVNGQEVPEGNNIVSIGYHYVATSNGIPLDSNGDGIPDYLEDANGDGIVNDGETNWALAILTQPVSQSVEQGTNVTFNVIADGVAPLTYQWYFNGTNLLSGATNSSITISNVQPANVGSYQVVVTNFSGSLTSSVATLTLTCDGPPSGMVGWWRGESNALDSAGINNGIVTNGVSYTTPGEVGTAFNFDGTNGFIQIPNAPDLEPTNLTIEAWVRVSSLYSTIQGGAPSGEQFIVEKPNSYGFDGYVLFMYPTNISGSTYDFFAFGINDTTNFPPYVGSVTGVLSNGVQTNVWYHLAGVRGSNNGTNYIQLYVNGQTSAAWTTNIGFQQTYGNYPLFLGSSGATDGNEGVGWNALLKGNLDEVSLYNRALSSNEIVAIYNAGSNGKCLLPNLSVNLTSPTNSQPLLARSNVTLTATVVYSSIPGTTTNWVQFFANGTNDLGWALINTNGTYQVNWIPPASGTNVLTAFVTNSSGLTAWSSPVTVYVRGLPTVTITNPVTSSVFAPSPVNITFYATATADGASITNVTFYLGTNILGTRTSSPYTNTWSGVTNGTYTLTAKATDSMGATGVSFPVQITVNPTNQAPYVYAGPNQTTNSFTAQLTGSVTDDGLPSNYLYIAWSRTSGTGTVTFGNSNQPVTTVTFSTTGTNVLQLTATDGQLTSNSYVSIVIVSNSPPTVYAGSNQTNVCPFVVSNFVIHLTPVAAFSNAVSAHEAMGIDYFSPSNSVMYSSYFTNTYQIFETLSPANGSSVPLAFASMTNLPPQEAFATVKDTNGGFTPGEIFTGNGNPGEIMRIRPDGTLVGTNGLDKNAWVALPDTADSLTSDGFTTGGLYVDQTGVFGGDLIAVFQDSIFTQFVDVWRINSAGQATFLAQAPYVPGDESYFPVVTVPNNIEKYGPWAGKILLGGLYYYSFSYNEIPDFTTIDTNATVVQYYNFQGSGISIIPPNENLYTLDQQNSIIWGAPASALQGLAGDILVTETPGNVMYAISWNGQAFVKTMVAVASGYDYYDWTQVAFAPAGLSNVFPSPYSVQLNGYVSDDGHIWSATSNIWVEVNGPGPVTFANPTQTNTVASFTMPGTYELRLIANDGEFTRYNDVTNYIIQNQAPVVSAGTNQVLSTTNTTLSGSVSDDGWPSNLLTISWSQISGPGTANFGWSTTNVTTTNFTASPSVNFTAAGTYILQLTASDGQASASTNVTITVATPQLTLIPAYSGPFVVNTPQTVTATLLSNSGSVISNAVVEFIVTGVTSYTNSVTNNINGIAELTYTNTSQAGRDTIQAWFTNGSQIVASQPVIVDWAINITPVDYPYEGYLTNGTTNGLSTDMPTNQLRYAAYFVYTNAQAGTTLTVQFAGQSFLNDPEPMLAFLKNSSNQVLAFSAYDTSDLGSIYSFPGFPDGFSGSLAYTLPVSGNYTIELTTAQTNDAGCGYYLLLSTNAPNPGMAVLFNGTNVPNGGTITFGTTLTNLSVTNILIITNEGNADLSLTNSQPSGDFQISLTGTNDVPTNSSTALTTIFNASSNETSVGTLVFSNNSAASPYVLNFIGSAFPAGTPPGIQLLAPTNYEVFYAPAVIPITAVVQPGSTNVSYVSFQAVSTTSGSQAIPLGTDTSPPYTLTWLNVPNGDYFITATAVDVVGRSTTTPQTLVHVLPASELTPPVAVNDQFTVLANSTNNILNPLVNDSDTNYNVSLTIVSNTPPQFGSATIINNGQEISYTPYAGVRGYDNFSYEITDGRGNTAWASIAITISGSGGPSVIITNPPNNYSVTSGVTIPLVAYVTPTQNVAQVDFYVGQNLVGVATNGVNGFFTNNWTPVCANDDECICPVVASATDISGQTGTSPQIQISVTESTNVGALYASLGNIVDAESTNSLTNMVVIREGLFNVYGLASNSVADSIQWQLGVYTVDGTLVRNLTPSPNSAGYNTNAIPTTTDLAACDLTTLMNGVYMLRLTALGNNQMTETNIEFILESNLKVGQFGFSQQDLTIPVNGIPLTVTRTYNSLDSDQDDFGYGWTYSLSDMDVSIDESRQEVTDGDGQQFSENMGGSQDVTLTLPNGQRTTFYYYLDPNSLVTAQPMWLPAPGVTAKLTAQDSATFYDFTGLDASYLPYWTSSDDQNVPDNNMDFPGYILTTQDGTVYYINRQDLGLHFINNGADDATYVHAYGNAYLSKIQELSGDIITINSNSIVHTYTNGISNTIVFHRNAQGLISSISDPNEQAANGPASVIYQYDSNNNLINVLNLVNASGSGTYATTSYAYTNVNFPHYITGIFNADGTQVAKNFYDSSGQLTGVQDANGVLTQFIHNTTNNMDVVIDRLGNTNTSVYDLRGNIIVQTNALNQVTTMAYDNFNNKISEVTFLGSSAYATNSYVYDLSLNEVSVSTDPLGHTNSFNYNNYNAELLNSTDARGNSTANTYDGYGNLTSTSDALGDTTTNFYNSANLLSGSKDALANITTNYYNTTNNLIGTATLSPSSTILSSNTFTYDTDGNRLTSTVWRHVGASWIGATTTNIYDAMNRVIDTIDPDGGTNTVSYDSTGKQQFTVDPLGRTNSYTYDALGRLIQTTYPDATTETNGYDANGNRIASADRLGRLTTYVYDQLNRLHETIYPDNTTNTTVYDGVGRVAQTIDARGTTNAFGYDIAGRRLAVTNAFGITGVQNVSSYSYDNNGNQLTFTDPDNHTTTNVFDALNRQVQVLYPDGTKTSTGYDADGRSVAQTNQDSIVTLFGYDGAGRLTTVTNALTKITSYQYDEAGNEIAQIDALGRTNSFVFDGMGRKISHAMPGNQSESFGYDLTGNMIYDTNFNGVIITNQYDVLNRLTNRASTNDYQVSYTYTPTGQRATMADPSGLTSYSYDNRDRVLTNATPEGTLFYAYDANGNVTSIASSTAGGTSVTYQYDALNRLTNVVDARLSGTQNTAYHFDLAGNLQSYAYPNGVTNLYKYDSLNRVTNVLWKLNATSLASFGYTLGLTGNRTALSETLTNVSRSYAWQYDNLYRLTNEALTVNNPIGTIGYTYDAVGNRTIRTNIVSGLGPTNQAFTFNTNDWLTGESYDNNGNTITNSSRTPCEYDVENRLTNFNGNILLVYDGDGNRVKKITSSTTTLYLVDSHNPSGYAQVLEELAVTTTTNLSKAYTYGLNLISQRNPGSSTNFFTYDGHGSTRMLTDEGGNIVNAFVYDAYGTLIASNTSPQTAYLYCGEQFDSDIGLYYNRARYLNTGTGRFLSSDSVNGNNEDPLSLHKYLYCEDSPVNGTDPSGNDDLDSMLMPVFSEIMNFSITPQGVVSFGNTCGPDVTTAVMHTMQDVQQTFGSAPPTTKKAAIWNIIKSPMDTMVGGWDIDKLFDLGYGLKYDEEGNPLDFGNGSSLGSGIGKDTVQFSYGGQKVYRAGSVNYILWGKIFSLAHSYYPHDPLFSETSAVETARWNKLAGHGEIFADYATEAVAFVKFGYSGTEDPSSTAMKLTPNPRNNGAPGRFTWKWLKLHDSFQ